MKLKLINVFSKMLFRIILIVITLVSFETKAQIIVHDWYYSDPLKYKIFTMTNKTLYDMGQNNNYYTGGPIQFNANYVYDFKIKLFEDIKDRRDSIRQVKDSIQMKRQLVEKGCFEGDCKNGYGRLRGALPGYSFTVNYQGDFKNGLPHGSGKMRYNSVDYVGDFVNGKKQGNGIAEYGMGIGDKSRYVGQWKDDKRNGEGTYFHISGVAYTGTWQNDKIIRGTAVLPDSNVFEGDFEQTKAIFVTGFGTVTYKDGTKKKGFVKNGKLVYEAETRQQVPAHYIKAAYPVYELIKEKYCDDEYKTQEVKDWEAKQLKEFQERLIAGADPDEYNAMFLSVMYNRIDMLRLLLQFRADPLIKNSSGELPVKGLYFLHINCVEQMKNSMGILEILLKAGTPADYKTVHGNFPLSDIWYNTFNQKWDWAAGTEPLAAQWAGKLMDMGIRFDVSGGDLNQSTLDKCKKYNKKLYKVLMAEMDKRK